MRLLREEKNARVHAVATAFVILVSVLLRLSRLEWAVLALAVAGVWAAEAMNSAIERLANVVSPLPHPLVGAAKDLAAASVLFAAIGAVVVGLFVFCPYLWSGFRTGW